jgi:hypothetical protein
MLTEPILGPLRRALPPVRMGAMGLDLSPDAVALARRESAGAADIDFRVLDLTVPGSTAGLAEEFQPANIFVRGVFHILNPADVGGDSHIFEIAWSQAGTPIPQCLIGLDEAFPQR